MATTDTLATFAPIRRRARRSGDEQDLFSRAYRANHVLRPGEVAATKARAARRTRREARRALRAYAA